ncbi:hypothetical protein [Vibrio splendidus]|nr:hypothetical protein [Vibrio splendidus]
MSQQIDRSVALDLDLDLDLDLELELELELERPLFAPNTHI